MSIDIIQFGPTKKDKKLQKQFVRFAWELYKDDPVWIPTFDMELAGNKLLGAVGLLTDVHPFHENAEVTYFMAKRNGKIVGRIAAIVNHAHNDFHNEKTGFFGFWETIEDKEVTKLLMDKVKEWLKQKGMKIMRGPANPTSNGSWGLLVENFKDQPMVYTTYNYPYYEKLLLDYGFKKEMDLIGQMMPVDDSTEDLKKRRERLERLSEKVKKRYGIEIRAVNMKKGFDEDLKHLRYIYNHAWGKNWGFVPINEHEFDDIAVGLKATLIPGLASIAFVKGEPGGFIASLTDVNEFTKPKKNFWGDSDIMRLLRFVKNKKKQTKVRLALFGITEKYRKIGLDSVLFVESFRAAQKAGIKECEISWLLETNDLVIRHGEAMGAKEYKRWRLYDYEIK